MSQEFQTDIGSESSLSVSDQEWAATVCGRKVQPGLEQMWITEPDPSNYQHDSYTGHFINLEIPELHILWLKFLDSVHYVYSTVFWNHALLPLLFDPV